MLLGRVAGEREEDLVEARLAEREVGDPTPARASSATASAARSASAHGADSAAGSGSRWTVAELARQHALGLGALLGIEQAHVQRAGADRRLELAGRALGDHLAVVDHGDPVGELVGLVEVLRAEQDRRPLGRPARG